ncbi:MAG: hypothetical protein ACFFFB_13040 [Candidatus Heimdallarchaeota archaeon]
MTGIYSNFMVFELYDNGEYKRLDIEEEDFRDAKGDGVLHPSQVTIIVREDLRCIFIWKGVESSVRKKFIASRVASELQQELMQQAGFHRCRIVSVDQGEEPIEFLTAFGFKSNVQKPIESKKSEGKNLEVKTSEDHKINDHNTNPKPFSSKSFKQLKIEKQSKNILEKVLKKGTPDNYKRKNILTGTNILYGEVIKKVNIFGEVIEEKEWEPIYNVPKEIFELEGHKLRIYFNNEVGEIEAIEILELDSLFNKVDKKESNYNNWTVKQLKDFCKENHITVPSSYRKADIVHLVKEFTNSEK